jgi:hypothetical protein
MTDIGQDSGALMPRFDVAGPGILHDPEAPETGNPKGDVTDYSKIRGPYFVSSS